MAERLRRRVYELRPLGRQFYLNGHSTRVLVRTVLRLIEAIDILEKEGNADLIARLPSRQALVELAKRHKTMLSAYMSRVPTERASLLIMEAQYVRIVGNGRRRALLYAQKLLVRADGMLGYVRHRPRIRLRFALERSLVLRALCLTLSEEGVSSPAHLRALAVAALQEAETLVLLSRKTPSWVGAADTLLRETNTALEAILAASRSVADVARNETGALEDLVWVGAADTLLRETNTALEAILAASRSVADVARNETGALEDLVAANAD